MIFNAHVIGSRPKADARAELRVVVASQIVLTHPGAHHSFEEPDRKKKVSAMKLALASLLVTSASAFGPQRAAFARQGTALNAAGLYYSTSTGNTETVAAYIADAAGLEAEEIGDADNSDIEALDAIIVGAPTWHTDADTERSGTSWDDWLYSTLPDLDLSGKKVAVFGCGDQEVSPGIG